MSKIIMILQKFITNKMYADCLTSAAQIIFICPCLGCMYYMENYDKQPADLFYVLIILFINITFYLTIGQMVSLRQFIQSNVSQD